VIEQWARLLADAVAVTPLLDHLMRHDLKLEGKNERM
jgi:hypothetical protein